MEFQSRTDTTEILANLSEDAGVEVTDAHVVICLAHSSSVLTQMLEMLPVMGYSPEAVVGFKTAITFLSDAIQMHGGASVLSSEVQEDVENLIVKKIQGVLGEDNAEDQTG